VALPSGASSKKTPASKHDGGLDVDLDQFYTMTDVAILCYNIFKEHFDPFSYQLIEPSAGTGSFLRLLPKGSWAYDLDPRYPGILKKNFLHVTIDSDRKVAVIGNPPFGHQASMAISFFNHAAEKASVIAFIVPRSFRKASMDESLDRNFHLVRDELLPDKAFLFRSKPHSVPATFQIWERRPTSRPKLALETRHPDFKFVKPAEADFAIQRIGARAGWVHHDMTRSESSHYFIQGDVESIMLKLDFASVVGNVAGNPSLAKSEIVSLYRAWVLQHPPGVVDRC
jgi:hypothetical protein